MSDVNGTVVAIQGRDVDSVAPNDGDVYRWDAGNSKWVPVAPPQPLEPWVGSVNTQAQVIQRIPWTSQTTGSSAASTGVSTTVPTDKALALYAYCMCRQSSSPTGAIGHEAAFAVINSGGSLTLPSGPATVATPFAGSVPGNPSFQLSSVGTTVTLEIRFPTAGGGVQMDCQGYVDLMIA